MCIRSGLNQKSHKNYLRDHVGISSGINFVIYELFHVILNNRFLREKGMASTLKMEYQVFLCIFQKNSATLPFKMFGMGQKVLSRLTWSKFWPIIANQ